MTRADLLIVGAGPAGMAAAGTARQHGLDVVVVDEQSSPGGQIWRAIELSARHHAILGAAYAEGREAAAAFRASGGRYLPETQIWHVEDGFRAQGTRRGAPTAIEARALILATGAQERPTPFPGWTLPGVLTVGAAQILLKSSGQIPADPVWIAGSGPLPLLYAVQLIDAGGHIAGFLDTARPGQWRAALPHLPRALRASRDLLKGLKWLRKLRRHARVINGVTRLEAEGDGVLQTIRYATAKGNDVAIPASALLVHEGVVPNIHPALSLGCAMRWDDAQDCFAPIVDAWGESSVRALFVAGDGAGIAGAKAAELRGSLAALGAAVWLGRLDERRAAQAARPLRQGLVRELAIRPFLDALYKPRQQILSPTGSTIVCRCEELTADTIRAAAAIGSPGPNQVKSATRAGMGPCQGRQCGYSVTHLLAETQRRAPEDVGFFHVRPPLKPVTLGELASLHDRSGDAAKDRPPHSTGSRDPHIVE